MSKKRSGFFVQQAIYEKVRDYCRDNDLVMARWVEQVCLQALSGRSQRVPVEPRPLPKISEPTCEEDTVAPWARPPFWHRS